MNNGLIFAIIASACTMWQYNNKPTEVTSLPDEHNYHIFFDIGGVLAKGYIPKAVWNIGPTNIVKYVATERSIPSRRVLQTKLFKYMDHITGMPTHGSILSCDRPLPGIMYNWITGKQSGNDMVDMLYRKSIEHKDFFKSESERKLVLGSANIFRPHIYGNMITPIPEMVELLKECLEKYPDRVYILSNWDESCDIIKKRFPEIFEKIPEDHIIFSWHAGCAKPDKTIFDKAALAAGLNHKKADDRAKIVLIDDGLENIDSNLLPNEVKEKYLALNKKHNGIIPWGGKGILHTDAKTTREKLIEILSN